MHICVCICYGYVICYMLMDMLFIHSSISGHFVQLGYCKECCSEHTNGNTFSSQHFLFSYLLVTYSLYPVLLTCHFVIYNITHIFILLNDLHKYHFNTYLLVYEMMNYNLYDNILTVGHSGSCVCLCVCVFEFFFFMIQYFG